MRAHAFVSLSAAALATACTQPRRVPIDLGAEIAAYCAIAAREDLHTWVGDVVTLCTGEEEARTCRVGRAGPDGVITPEDLPSLEVERALPASDGRLVMLLADGRLVVVRDGAIERELSAAAAAPSVGADGRRVVWVSTADGTAGDDDFGATTRILAQDLDAPAPELVVDDPHAFAALVVPGSADVLYMSTASGVASFWLAGVGREPRQLTNIGSTEAGQSYVPVAGRQLAWTETGALYYASAWWGDESRLYRLSLEPDAAGEHVVEVARGAWPRARADGSIVALDPPGATPCAGLHPEGGAP
jgi:hypothetical protein